jgi:hypothetical protein
MFAVTSQPYLLLDVDGVLSPTTGVAPRGFRRVETPDYRVTLSDQHGGWLRELSEMYELVWATSWGDAANHVYAHLLGLPQLPVVPLPRPTAGQSWKLPHVVAWVGARPLAWVDDELVDDALAWGANRVEPTLLLRTDGSVGLREPDVQCLREFAASL